MVTFVIGLVHFSVMLSVGTFCRYMVWKSEEQGGQPGTTRYSLRRFVRHFGDVIPLLAIVFTLCWAYVIHLTMATLKRWWRQRAAAVRGATSLADFHEVYGASFITVSLPERGEDRQVQGEAYRFGKGPYGAPVMDIIEELPLHLHNNVVFLNAVDFAGSTSGKACAERIRWANPEDPENPSEQDLKKPSTRNGNVVYCGDDFKRKDLRNVNEFKDLDPKEYEMKCIEHSQWIAFWCGQVSGGVKAALANIREVGFPSKRVQRSARLPVFREGSMWEDPSYWTMAVSMMKEFLPIRGVGKLRTLVVLSVDGGPVTKVEKFHIPALVQNALSDLRCRHYNWTPHARIVWAHFPTVEDLLHSFDGLQNLVHDEDPHNKFATDCYDATLTFKWAGKAQEPSAPDAGPRANEEPQKSYAYSLFQRGGLSQLLSLNEAAQDENANVSGFRSAIAANDEHTVRFIVDKFSIGDMQKAVNGALSHRYDRGPQAPLLQAASHGSVEVLRALLELEADINAHDPQGRGALHHAVIGHRPSREVVETLLSWRADVLHCSVDGRTAAEHARPVCDQSSEERRAITALEECEKQQRSEVPDLLSQPQTQNGQGGDL